MWSLWIWKMIKWDRNLSYTLHALIRQTNTTIWKKYTCKPFQNHAKCPQGIPLRGNEVSDTFNHTRMGVYMKNMRKCTKEISHDLGCRSAVWKKYQITRSADPGKALIVELQFLEHQNSNQNSTTSWQCKNVARRQTDDVTGRYCTTSHHQSCVIHCLLRHGIPIWILVL
jgi:hypothetical protein